MQTFRTRPPIEADRIPYRIQRVGTGKALCVYVLSDAPVVVGTHWTGSRSVRCPENDTCGYCAAGKEIRWRGYVFGQCPRSGSVQIIEYTGGCGKQVADFYDELGSLRGVKMTLRRRGKAKNSAVFVEFGNEVQRSTALPEIPDLGLLVCRIYDVRRPTDLEQAQDQSTVRMNRYHA